MDPAPAPVDPASFARSYKAFVETMTQAAEREAPALSEVGEYVQDFLGVPIDDIDPVVETFPVPLVVDADLALESLLAEHQGERRGINGLNRRHAETFGEYLRVSFMSPTLGPVSYQRMATGPDSETRVVTFGMGQLRVDGVPLVWLQQTPEERYGRDRYTLELLCPRPEVADDFLRRLRERMAELSVLRGQVISFAPDHFDRHSASGSALTFQHRPAVAADQVVLPEGVLDRIVRHVVGIGEQREALLDAGQHLKRGVLLYGPPGTGKTHLIRHLLTQTPGTTAVLLSGKTLGLLHDATKLARSVEPAIVVLEDCDLVAEHRGGSTNAVLFETLEAMDGLTGDADITFILTTNRVDLLERALVERPGRVDLAVEITKPDLEGRERLFRLYAADLLAAGQLTEQAVRVAAERTEGVTASFTKELIRRVVVDAALQQRSPGDADVSHALDEMLSDAERLTRTLLGGELGPLPVGDEEDDLGGEDFDEEPLD